MTTFKPFVDYSVGYRVKSLLWTIITGADALALSFAVKGTLALSLFGKLWLTIAFGPLLGWVFPWAFGWWAWWVNYVVILSWLGWLLAFVNIKLRDK